MTWTIVNAFTKSPEPPPAPRPGDIWTKWDGVYLWNGIEWVRIGRL